jgi:hypothetical protein
MLAVQCPQLNFALKLLSRLDAAHPHERAKIRESVLDLAPFGRGIRVVRDGMQTTREYGFRRADALLQLARVIFEQGVHVLHLPVGIVD